MSLVPSCAKRFISSAVFYSLVLLVGLLPTLRAKGDDLLFDDMTKFEAQDPGINGTTTGSTPNTFMGFGADLQTNANSITGFDLFPVNLTGTNFNALKLTVYVWDTVNKTGTVNAATPAFSNLLSSYTLTSTGAFTSGFFYSFEGAVPGVDPGITLGTPLALNDNEIGLTFNYQGSTDGGVTYNNVNSLTSLIIFGTDQSDQPPQSVGSPVFNGYYRNAAAETNGNFVSSLRSLGVDNQQLGVRVYGTIGVNVPEPTAISLVMGAGLFLARRRRA